MKFKSSQGGREISDFGRHTKSSESSKNKRRQALRKTVDQADILKGVFERGDG